MSFFSKFREASTSMKVVAVSSAVLMAATTAAIAQASPTSQAAQAATVKAPAASAARASSAANYPIGVATFNVHRGTSFAQQSRDMSSLLSSTRIDLIGLQEVNKSNGAIRRLQNAGFGWVRWKRDGKTGELAVAWRKSRFVYLGSKAWKAHRGGGTKCRDCRPYGSRYTGVVWLKDRVTGERVDMYTLHANQWTERLPGPQGTPRANQNARDAKKHFALTARLMRSSKAKHVFLTGDFNIGYEGDRIKRAPGFPWRTFSSFLESSYQKLAFRGARQTHFSPDMGPRGTARHIDYVWKRRAASSDFLWQWGPRTHSQTKPGRTCPKGYGVCFFSDHNPVVARVQLN